jgi:soluble lytic murein transglycosylase
MQISLHLLNHHSFSVIFVAAYLLCQTEPNHAAPVTSRAQTIAANDINRDWLAAKEAFDRRDVAVLNTARQKFASRQDFALTPYVTYWSLSAQLSQGTQNVRALNSDIEKFIAAHPNTPFTDQLQRDHLRALGRQTMWPQFSANEKNYLGEDNEVACHRLQFRLQNDDRNVQPVILADVKSMWTSAKPTADACDALYSRLISAKQLSQDAIWRRTRTLFENGQLNDARRSASFVANLPARFEAISAEANLDPKRFLDRQALSANEANRANTELALFAISRLARNSAKTAAEWLAKNEKRLSREDAQYAWAEVGYWGAMQLEADALAWFERAGDSKLNDNQAAWRVRAALRDTAINADSWRIVRATITAMSAEEKRDSAWRYWLARALSVSTEASDIDAARTLRESLAREKNFYGVLAAEELGLPIVPNFQAHLPTDAQLAEVAKRGGIQRAFLLYQLAENAPLLRNEALREWQFAIRNMDDQTLLATSALALKQDLPDRAINTAERTQTLHDFSQRYPLPHRAPLQASARQNNLDEAWVFGLIRQESRFITDARSRVGAQGLMQLMPPTATWVAKQTGMKNFVLANVADVATNLALGSYYLRHVLDDLGHPVLATAGYNAGPGRARRWRAETPLEGAIYAESIPFNETRDYVKKVMVNKWFYSHRIHGKAPTLSAIMGMIPSKRQSVMNRAEIKREDAVSNFTIIKTAAANSNK